MHINPGVFGRRVPAGRFIAAAARLRPWRTALVAVLAAVAVSGCGGPRERPRPDPIEITLLGLNDFHGNLEPPRLAVNTAVTSMPRTNTV